MVLAVGLSMNSCKKYDEGPMISLRSKSARIVNAWVIDKVMTSGVDVSSQFSDDFVFTLNKDNTYSILSNGNSEDGTWDFTDKKEGIQLTNSSSGTTEIFTIIMLKNKELTLEQVVQSETYTYYFVEKP